MPVFPSQLAGALNIGFANKPIGSDEWGRRSWGRTAEHERQFRETLELCPAGLCVIDEDGRLLFHNARLRELTGYEKQELELFDTRRFWHDLDQRARIIAELAEKA